MFGGDSGGRIVNRWMREHLPRASRPTFLFVNYMECHWAYAPPPEFARRVGGPRHRGLAGLRYRTSDAVKRGPWEAIARAGADELERLSTLYDGELANADHHLAELLDILDKHRAPAAADDRDRRLRPRRAHRGARPGRPPRVARRPAGARAVRGLGPGVRRTPAAARRPFEFVDVLPSLLSGRGDGPGAAGRPAPRRVRRRPATATRSAYAEWRAWPEGERARLGRRNPSFDFAGLGRDLVSARDGRFKLVRGSDGTRQLFDLEVDAGRDDRSHRRGSRRGGPARAGPRRRRGTVVGLGRRDDRGLRRGAGRDRGQDSKSSATSEPCSPS